MWLFFCFVILYISIGAAIFKGITSGYLDDSEWGDDPFLRKKEFDELWESNIKEAILLYLGTLVLWPYILHLFKQLREEERLNRKEKHR